MESKKEKHLGIEIDKELYYKLQHIAQYEARSINSHIMYLIRQDIKRFEMLDGVIEVPTEPKDSKRE